jgi:hypothetical protein
MSEAPRRLQQIVREDERDQEGHRLTPLPEEQRAIAGERGEELSTEERLALGHLVGELDANRQEVAAPLSLAEWKSVMERVRRELGRSDLTRDQRRALMADIRSARRRGQGWLKWATLAALGAATAVGSLWWLIGR